MIKPVGKQKSFFQRAYELGEQRIPLGYGWPMEVDPQQAEFLRKIKESIPNGRALDIGCGQGRHTFMFAQHGFDAYGIDFLELPIEEAQDRAKKAGVDNIHFEVMNVLELNFSDNIFDVVLDWSVLDHIYPKDWAAYRAHVARVLKPGGYLLLSEFSSKDARISDPSENARDEANYDHFFREDEIEKLFSKNFEIVEVTHNELQTTSHFAMINVMLQKRL